MTERGPQVRQTIILAAGNGRRLESDLPKPLVAVAGRPMLAHALEQAEAVGCGEAVVVVGHGAGSVTDYLERLETPLSLRVVVNPDYVEPNGVSVLAAEGAADSRFLLQMADHVFDRPVLARLFDGVGPDDPEDGDPRSDRDPAPVRVLIDRVGRYQDLDDVTNVATRDGRVVAIGKGLESWDAIDAGCFVADGRLFEALRRELETAPPTLSAGMRRLARNGELGFAELDDADWVDVDTPPERELAERLLGAREMA